MAERTNPHAEIVVGAQDKATPAFDDIRRSAENMAAAVERSASKAGNAMGQVGDKSEKSARATTNALSSLARAQSEVMRSLVEASGYAQKSADGIEYLAKLRNADVTAIQGQVAALRDFESVLSNVKAAQKEASSAALFEQQHQAAAKLVQDAEYVRVWTNALDLLEAKQREIAALPAFERDMEAAAQARRRADATYALTQALDIQEAKEREIAALPAFERERLAANEIRRRADATAAFLPLLQQQEAAEQRLRQQTDFLGSLKGQTDAIGKTRSELMAMQAAQMGVTAQAEPFIAKLREQEKRFDANGLSAKQMTAALRQVPAQLTDIVVSLQGGQAPLTVLLQQGGQLKDMFGGVGQAARVMGSYVLGLVNPVSLTAAAAAGLAVAYYQGSKEADAYRLALVSTGNAAGVTLGQMNQMAASIDGVVGTQGKAAETLAMFASQVVAGGQSLEKYAQSAIAWERASGESVESVAKKFGSLKDAPLQGVLKLNESMNFLTDSVYQQIKSLEEQGKTTEAAKVAQDALANALDSRSGEMVKNLGAIEKAWRGIKDVVSETWDAIKGIGRDAGPEGRVEAQRQTVANLEALAARGGARVETPQFQAKLDAAREALSLAEHEATINQLNAAIDADRAVRVKARADADKDALKYLSDQEKMTRQIAVEREKIRAAYTGLTDADSSKKMAAEIEASEKNIRASYDKTKKVRESAGIGQNEVASIRAKVQEQERYLALLQSQGADAQKLTEGEKLVIKIQEELKTSISGAARAQKEKALAAAESLAAVDKQIVAEQAHVKAIADSEAAYRKDLAAMAGRTDSIEQQAIALEEANASFGKSKIAIEAEIIAREKRRLAMLQSLGLEGDTTAELEREIKARERLTAAMKVAEYKSMSKTLDEQLAQAKDANALVREEVGLIGMSEEGRKKIIAARMVENELAKELRKIDASSQDDPEKEALRIKARSEAAIKAETAAARVTVDAWQKTADEINRSLTDALLRGFESGKGFAQNLRDTLKNMFSTLVLRPIISAVMTPVSMAMNGAVQGGMNAMGLGGGSNLLGMASNASSAYSLVSGGFGAGLASSLGGAASAAGSIFGSSAMSAFGAGMQGSTLAAGLMGPTTAGATGAMGAGASFGSTLAAIPGWGWAAAGIGALLLGSGVFGSRGANHSGGVFSTATTDRNDAVASLGISGGAAGDLTARANLEVDKQLGATVGALSGVYQSLAKYAGDSAKQIDVVAGFAVNGKYKDEDAYAYFKLLDKNGGQLASYQRRDGGLGNDPTKAYAQFTADMGGALIEELKKADIPSWMRTVFDGLDKDITLDKLNAAVALVGQLGGLFENMSKNLVGFAGMADTTFEKLVQQMGGVQAAAQNVGAYYQNFYSEPERAANVRRDIESELANVGITLPATREEFRAMVEANIALGDAGAKTVAVLLKNAGAFASVTKEAEDTAAKLQAAADALKQQRSDAFTALDRAVAAEKRLLQDRMTVAQDVERSISGIFDTLHSNVQALYGEVDSTRGMQAAQAQDFIAQALSTARASGYLPDGDQLAEAIRSVRGELDVANYGGNRAERDYAALVLAGQLSGMEEIAGKQLTDAQRTIRVLEGQTRQLDETLDYWRQQIDIANGTYSATLSVADAVGRLSALLNPSKGGPTSAGGGGSSSYTAGGTYGRPGYGADEALTSFEKFKPWYEGLRQNLDPKLLQSDSYQVPDWMRLMHMASDGTDKELFGAYLNMKNNPETAKDYERIMLTGRSSMATDGSTLVRSDLSTMPKDVADYFANDRNSLLSYEAMGIDPVLGYKLYSGGGEQFGISAKDTNFTAWLQQHKWTDQGVVENNNAMDLLNNWKGYNLSRWDLSNGTIVDLDGRIYTPDGQLIGTAGKSQMESIYGSAFVGASGMSYGDTTRSALYNQAMQGGYTEQGYYTSIKQQLDDAINSGKSAQDIADAIRSTGSSMGDVAAAYGITVQQLEDNLRAGGAANIPKFAVGTNYVPKDMLAQIHEGEAIVPKAFNPWAGGQSGGNADMLAELRALRIAVAALQAAADATAGNTAQSAAVLVSAKSGNAITTAPAPVF